MNNEMKKYIIYPCSDAELERRWEAAAQVMEENSIDYLIITSRTDYLGGYIKWFTDLPALHDYVASVIFSRDKEMITIWSGPEPPQAPNPPAYCVRGVKKQLSRPFIPSLNYSCTYDAELVVQQLASKGKVTIGLVGQAFMTVQFYKYITANLTQATFVDADDLIDELKAVKSDEEIEMIKEVCVQQDEVIAWLANNIEPGMKEIDVYANIRYQCHKRGAENAIIMVGSNSRDKAAGFYYEHFHSNRTIQKGDTVTILIESNGPSGMYAHIGRIFTLGEPTDDLYRDFEWAKKAQAYNLQLLKPGADCRVIWKLHNEFMRDHGLPEETRIYTHGQGYDLVERPSISPDEKMIIKPRMNICPHPTVFSPATFAFVCENYIVKEDGTHELLHKTPQEIIKI